ncbi:MAG: helix-hairpin-helix domain-containing protein [Candidatus Wallbacteria bacterium]|nr:helix-hairpin-helix domain-containing protein [Candidatus Wallbacteria bacterium]
MIFLPRFLRPLLALGVLLLLAVATPGGLYAQVDLNSASYSQLAAVDGISESMAQKIINARPLRTKRDLVTRLGMQESVYSRVSDQVVARQRQRLRQLRQLLRQWQRQPVRRPDRLGLG